MKHTRTLTRLLLICTLLTACNKSNLNFHDEYEKSYNSWLSFKQQHGNSYAYAVAQGSWTGVGSQTIITVKDGKVTQRYFKMSLPPAYQVTISADKLEWTETESEIDTHPGSGAAGPLTLDQIYEKARTEWLPKKPKTTAYFEAKNDGMISSCGYVNDGCQDDCFIGIGIAFIHSL
ncbi:MAG TPA: hypothetical protein VL727_21955 [Puia sp.]|nr:hypothetical protein [Puia sp.]